MSSADEELEKDFYEASIQAGIVQQQLTLWYEGLLNGTDREIINKYFAIAFYQRKEIELKGFPVDIMISRFFSFREPAFTNPVVLVSVTVHKPPKNGTPAQKADYDRWFRRINGIADDPPNEPPSQDK